MRRLAPLLLLPLLAAAPALAQQTWWETDALVADMFPVAEQVEVVQLTLTPAEQAAFRKALGYAPPRETWELRVARTGDHVDGVVVLDEQKGQHEPISFAVQLSPEATVLRLEVMVYREKYGEGIVDPRFRGQFEGRTRDDRLALGKDVRVVSGATYSSRAMTVGVKRAIVLTDLWRARQSPTP